MGKSTLYKVSTSIIDPNIGVLNMGIWNDEGMLYTQGKDLWVLKDDMNQVIYCRNIIYYIVSNSSFVDKALGKVQHVLNIFNEEKCVLV